MFKVGDKIVYPMHGAGTIESIEEREVLGETQKYYVMKMPVGDIKVMIPSKNEMIYCICVTSFFSSIPTARGHFRDHVTVL